MNAITFSCFLAPGDVIPITSVVRDLRIARPELPIYVQCRHREIFDNNPHVTKLLSAHDTAQNVIKFDYRPVLLNSVNSGTPFVHAMHELLFKKYNIRIEPTRFGGDLHLSEEEKVRPRDLPDGPYWLIVCGGKTDFTTKWWNPLHAAKVVEHFKNKITFIQVGRADSKETPPHIQFPIPGTVNKINQTNLRQLISLAYHSEGAVCPITALMHIMAALPKQHPNERNKPCVVTAGGREPPSWNSYPGQRYLHTIGLLDCCADRPCWARRCQLVKDASMYNTTELCLRPVQVSNMLRVPQCMDMVTPNKVIEAIEDYMFKPDVVALPVLK